MTITMEPIGTVRSTRSEVEDDAWDRERGYVELDARFGADALAGPDTFTHAEVIFHMDRVRPEKIETGARHPRNNTDWPAVGIFAQRGKNRPNRVGSTICPLVRVEERTLFVRELDAIDGTPVLDIKPVMSEFLPRAAVRQPAWSHELMRQYWLKR